MNLVINNPKTFKQLLSVANNFEETIMFEVEDNILSINTYSTPKFFRGIYHIENTNINDCFVIPDFRRFIRLIDLIDEEKFTLKVNTNNLTFDSIKYKFKYHTYDKNIYKRKKIDIDKIKEIPCIFTTQLHYDNIKQLIKIASLSDDDTKAYIYSKNNNLYSDITNKEHDNTNSISTLLKENINEVCDIIALDVGLFRTLLIYGDTGTQYNFSITNNKIAIIETEFSNKDIFTFICSSYAK